MIHPILALLDNGVSAMQTLLYVDIVQPLFYRFGLMDYDEDTYEALDWVIIGVPEIVVTYAALRPLEALRPVETWQDRKSVRTDVVYTWIARLGIINIAFFFMLQPLFDYWQSLMVIHDVPNIDLDSIWSGVTDQPVVSFVIYLVVLEFLRLLVSPLAAPVRRVVGTARGAS
jgi:sterol desaturase/sphingolipid hydroxylase (fatty acid hydroxylase superfamily)